MMDARKLAYLDAMGIDVWLPPRGPVSPQDVADTAPLITVEDGDGSILCIAGTREEAKLKLAADISRAMTSPPVWAWPVPESGAPGGSITIDGAVADRLFTRVLVFGSALAEELFESGAPGIIGAARVHVVPGLQSLGGDRQAKRTLWQMMCEQGIAADRRAGKPGT